MDVHPGFAGMQGYGRRAVQSDLQYMQHGTEIPHRLISPTAADHERKPRSLPTAFAFLMSAWFIFFGTPTASAQATGGTREPASSQGFHTAGS